MGLIPIGVHADITEVVRYDYAVLVDESLSVAEQDKQAKVKLFKYLLNHLAMEHDEYIEDVKCVDSESVSQESINCIEINDNTHS